MVEFRVSLVDRVTHWIVKIATSSNLAIKLVSVLMITINVFRIGVGSVFPDF